MSGHHPKPDAPSPCVCQRPSRLLSLATQVLLVLNGGKGTLETVLETLKKDRPVVVLEDSGGCAADIWRCVCSRPSSRLSSSRDADRDTPLAFAVRPTHLANARCHAPAFVRGWRAIRPEWPMHATRRPSFAAGVHPRCGCFSLLRRRYCQGDGALPTFDEALDEYRNAHDPSGAAARYVARARELLPEIKSLGSHVTGANRVPASPEWPSW